MLLLCFKIILLQDLEVMDAYYDYNHHLQLGYPAKRGAYRFCFEVDALLY
jgi:hypothetical protein